MVITFLRTRPSETVNALSATTRLREGTTVLELTEPTATDLSAAASGGLLVSSGSAEAPAPAYVLDPTEALRLTEVAPWRITVIDDDDGEVTLDAVARTRPAYLRTGRSRVLRAVELVRLPGNGATAVSVFVDTIEDAVAAVADGATDLLLRDWDAEGIGQLREALAGHPLVERTAFPPGIDTDQAREQLEPAVFTTWLALTDGGGAVRPRYRWAPGNEHPLPTPPHRLSAGWSDRLWVTGSAEEGTAGGGALTPILDRALAGEAPTGAELADLFRARGAEVEAVAWTADQLRRRECGETVTYVINRNINYTNMCYFRCGFCAFSKGPRSLNLRGEPYLMGLDEIVQRAREAWDRGATEVTLQGGIHPEFTGDFYVSVVEAIKAELPSMHIHGFTPLEVWQGAETLGVTVRDFLLRLRDAGLGSLPGTAAEILDDRVREHLCPDKIRTAQWAQVMLIAHELGLRSTATIMFGHIDGPESWANHLDVLREIQRRTGGFTELVPLPFVHMGSPIFLRGKARPGPTWDEVVLVHAVSRIALHGLVPNIQASWVKLGLDGGSRLLEAGCNDLGGTLMGEIITRSAGASHGQEVSPADFEEAILASGRTPARRSTLYEILERA